MDYRQPAPGLKPEHERPAPSPAPRPRFRGLPAAVLLAAACLAAAGCGAEKGPRDSAGQAAADSVDPKAEAWKELAAAHVLIMYEGSRNAPPELRRSRPEAEDLALHVAEEARQGVEFEDLALRYSEEPGVEQTAGHLGNFLPTKMDIDFVAAIVGLQIGQITVHESEFGFHVIKRLPVERLLGRHILIAWRGAEKSTEMVTRTEPQAEALAAEVARMAAAPDADLCELARKFSDDADSKLECGLLGVLERGMAPPEIERAIFRLRPGRVSDPVRTSYGYHILWRER